MDSPLFEQYIKHFRVEAQNTLRAAADMRKHADFLEAKALAAQSYIGILTNSYDISRELVVLANDVINATSDTLDSAIEKFCTRYTAINPHQYRKSENKSYNEYHIAHENVRNNNIIVDFKALSTSGKDFQEIGKKYNNEILVDELELLDTCSKIIRKRRAELDVAPRPPGGP